MGANRTSRRDLAVTIALIGVVLLLGLGRIWRIYDRHARRAKSQEEALRAGQENLAEMRRSAARVDEQSAKIKSSMDDAEAKFRATRERAAELQRETAPTGEKIAMPDPAKEGKPE